ncbi:hypothetical protein [Aeromonas enteropelogenes]|uniref:hypothetical protein n=1 Tax=Aeromonas enteropelogenes TaxID=29489 RepID=UPI002286A2CF|nr:hypothetical protein [Aeromonas enteropelogenes]MCZ0753792.1 hypothetical protein [Aeromonas enteropelogenes]
MTCFQPLHLAHVWRASGLVENGQWIAVVRELVSPDSLSTASPLLAPDALAVGLGQRDVVISSPRLATPVREGIVDAYQTCRCLTQAITETRSRYRILIIAAPGSDQLCIHFPNGTAVAVVAVDTALSGGDLYHEAAHLFALSGHTVIDEGLAVFVEEVAPLFVTLERAEAARGWLQRKVRNRMDTRNPYAFGSASIAAALLTGGTRKVRQLIHACQVARTEEICHSLMTQVLNRAVTLMSETHCCTASIDPDDDYFAGRHGPFRVYAQALVQRVGQRFTHSEWRVIARFAGLLASEASADPITVDAVARIAAEVPVSMDDIEWLFEVARRLKALRMSQWRDGFAAAARGLIKMLEAKVTDPALGPDATITLMYLYRYLPDFAGGSIHEALRLSEEISTRYGKKDAASRLQSSLEEDHGIVY